MIKVKFSSWARMNRLYQVPVRLEGARRSQNVELGVCFEEIGIAAVAGLAADEEHGTAKPHQGRLVKSYGSVRFEAWQS